MPVTEEEVKDIISKRIPKSTQAKSQWAVKMFRSWLENFNQRDGRENKFENDIDQMCKEELNNALHFFISEVRKENGERYPPASLKSIVAMLQHHLVHNLHKPWSIFNDVEFKSSIAVLDGNMKLGAELGLVKPKKRAVCLSQEDEEEMWKEKAFGTSSPKQLLLTLIYHLGLHLSLRACHEHHDLEYGKLLQNVFH